MYWHCALPCTFSAPHAMAHALPSPFSLSALCPCAHVAAHKAFVLQNGHPARVTLRLTSRGFYGSADGTSITLHAALEDASSLAAVVAVEDAVRNLVLRELTPAGSLQDLAARGRGMPAADLVGFLLQPSLRRREFDAPSMTLKLQGWEHLGVFTAKSFKMRGMHTEMQTLTGWRPWSATRAPPNGSAATLFVQHLDVVTVDRRRLGVRVKSRGPTDERRWGPQDVVEGASIQVMATPCIVVKFNRVYMTWTMRCVQLPSPRGRMELDLDAAVAESKHAPPAPPMAVPAATDTDRAILIEGIAECCITLEVLAPGTPVAQCVQCHTIATRAAFEEWLQKSAHRDCPLCRSREDFTLGILMVRDQLALVVRSCGAILQPPVHAFVAGCWLLVAGICRRHCPLTLPPCPGTSVSTRRDTDVS